MFQGSEVFSPCKWSLHEAQLCCREAHPAPQIMPQKTLSGSLTLKCQNIVALGLFTADGVCVGSLGIGVETSVGGCLSKKQ